MKYINFTTIVLVVFGAYVLHSVYIIYMIFKPPKCKGGLNKCITPYYNNIVKEKFSISIFTSTKEEPSMSSLTMLWSKTNFNFEEYLSMVVNASIPRKTRNNGTMFVHIFLHPLGSEPDKHNELVSHSVAPLTKFMVEKSKAFNLMSEDGDNATKSSAKVATSGIPVTHWRPRLTYYILTDSVSFKRHAIPGEIFSIMRISRNGKYMPFLYIDELEMLERNLKPVNTNTKEMELKIEYAPIGIGKLRCWRVVRQSMDTMKSLGFSDKDLDEVKGIFTDTNLYLLALTFAISVFHLLFDFLAFKNDIIYWRKRSTMVGLSTRAVLWRCLSTAIIFLYLLDEKTSLLVLIPTGIGFLIEVWKVTKALKITVLWNERGLPSFQFGEKSSEEKETEEFDSQAMKYLSYGLYPLVVIGAVYSLLYQPHRSWYSWIIRSLVNGVYVFGFIFMLPQLFVNYKLKSVAHLPWRALMYKAFNTFIDDVFAFIITMPTAHRLACFRDDIVFVIYLYQRWLYPVDVKRANEFGVSYEDEKEVKEHKD
ncbi:cleft lip and palate transmembrane protein 1-like protein [Dendronephthya gigantea]|uniref:cleft lip and palate transmembrane protein 1-like protein n=1 Tax=Dendronephthya gigantea TaxID=151771 RepID=UPI001069C74E|nr:cleft lip and palate transmembrane protein 1-like protein [Dendronephthya gigantea]XP_028409931.1 cleft lip and palate transmembrane protein 1-like protein [Dendronephthya gigantea]